MQRPSGRRKPDDPRDDPEMRPGRLECSVTGNRKMVLERRAGTRSCSALEAKWKLFLFSRKSNRKHDGVGVRW